MRYRSAVPMALSALVLSGCLSGGGGGGGSDEAAAPTPEVTRTHDDRVFTAELPETLPLALVGTEIYFGKYDGLQGEAIYAVEVPDDWDGRGVVSDDPCPEKTLLRHGCAPKHAQDT